MSLALEAGEMAGVVAVAGTVEELLYQRAFGWRNASAATPMTMDTVFMSASMTKTVTSVAAMQLVEQGRLSLDEPLGRLVPDFANPMVLEGFDERDAPRLRGPHLGRLDPLDPPEPERSGVPHAPRRGRLSAPAPPGQPNRPVIDRQPSAISASRNSSRRTRKASPAWGHRASPLSDAGRG